MQKWSKNDKTSLDSMKVRNTPFVRIKALICCIYYSINIKRKQSISLVEHSKIFAVYFLAVRLLAKNQTTRLQREASMKCKR